MSYFGLKVYVEKEEKITKQKAVEQNILDGIELEPKIVTIDYSSKIADGSPLVFGGAHAPQTDEAWKLVADSGVTFLRTDFFLEYNIPNMTIEGYKQNQNDIQNVANWNQNFIKKRMEVFDNAKKYNMKTLGIVSYAPNWLTYSGTQYGVPKDWNVYEDIVKKTYKLYRDDLDYIEIWNEPTYPRFLDLTNSNMSREEAYLAIYLHASKAIKEVESEIDDGRVIPIGGFVAHTPEETEMLSKLLKNNEFTSEIDFLSYHNYEHLPEPSKLLYIPILKLYNFEKKPLFITEWNYSPDEVKPNVYNTSNIAIIYTASKLISYLNNSITGANYFLLDGIKHDGGMGFYKIKNGNVELLPQAKSWRILSKSLALGKGKSTIVQATEREDINALGFINSENIYGGAFVNNTSEDELIEFKLRNTFIKKRAKIDIYIASPE